MTISRLRPLVSAQWLSARLAALKTPREVRVLDTSFSRDPNFDSYTECYKTKHIPGSKFFNLYQCVDATKYIPRNIPEVQCFTDYLRSLGVWSDTHVVTYDPHDLRAAFRVWWMLRLFGHENVSVLDGGLGKWESDGHPTETEDPAVEPGDFTPKMNFSILRDYDAMVKTVETGSAQIVDSREEAMYCGTPDDPQSGHMPNAKNVPYPSLFNPDGTLKPEQELQRLFNEAGIDLRKPVVATCLFGVTACALVMSSELLGSPGIPVYYGSWTEWGQRAPPNLCVQGKD